MSTDRERRKPVVILTREEADKLRQIARAQGMTPTELARAWIALYSLPADLRALAAQNARAVGK